MKMLLFISFLLLHTINFVGDDLIGYWIDNQGELIVQCYKYSNNYYGVIKWFDNPNPTKIIYSKEGVPKNKWLGYVVMRNFVFVDGVWVEGHIHEIKSGKVYDAKIEMTSKNEIKVRGYVFVPMIGENMIFKRYFGKLPEQK
jgi:uncharacterized protein (DUF2147 family)